MTTKQKLVLRELDAIDRIAGGTEAFEDRWFKPFHVRYFRHNNPLREAGIALDSVRTHLRNLVLLDLVTERRHGRGPSEYKITDAGRAAIRRETMMVVRLHNFNTLHETDVKIQGQAFGITPGIRSSVRIFDAVTRLEVARCDPGPDGYWRQVDHRSGNTFGPRFGDCDVEAVVT